MPTRQSALLEEVSEATGPGASTCAADGYTRRLTGRTGMERDILHAVLLVCFDLFAVFQAFNLAFWIRTTNPRAFANSMSQWHFAELVAVLSPVWVVLLASAGLYSVRHRMTRLTELGRILLAVTVGVMALVVLDYMKVVDPIFPGRLVPVIALPLGVAFVFVCRQFVRWLVRQAQLRGHALRRVVLVGSGWLAEQVGSELATPASGCLVLGVVSREHDGGVFGRLAAETSRRSGPATVASAVPVLPSLDAAIERFGGDIDEVVQADVTLDRDEIARMMSLATGEGIVYRFVPDQYGVYAANTTSMTSVAGIPVMDLRLTALGSWGTVAKRVFDVLTSGALILLLSPLLLSLALLVKITDPAGPIFYSQHRLGRSGRGIKVLKFRSMGWKYSTGPDRPFRTAEEAFMSMGRPELVEEFVVHHKVQDDPRITPLGRVLRQTSLDELPQLFDVLRGDLSLIGPRPITPEELELYGSQRASFLALKPGITGLWQVSGRSDISFDERVKLDIFYVENWSMKLDLAILARTTTAVLAKRGAY